MSPLLHEVLRLERTLIGIDSETTGTNPATGRIVELGLEIFKPDGTIKEYRTYINPGCHIPESATAIHHITDEMVADAPSFGALAENFLIGFRNADFAGYNVRFDLRMLSAEFKRAKCPWDYEGARIIDGFRLWQIAEKRSLEDAVKRYLPAQQQVGEAHSALTDAKWSTRVIAGQLRTFTALPRDLDRLHALCAPGWYDAEGKLQWRNGDLCISFGQHKDTPLRQIPKSYLHWIATKGDFSQKVKTTCDAAMRGSFPAAPDAPPPVEDTE